ncbi:lectin-like domain-containing protein [Pyrobaculum aerophilum]|nr:hypothetical protein [Pyrobaculum aerophilum]
MLTAIEYGRAGALYLKLNLTRYYKWQVDFIYFIGNSTDPDPADGLALNFYREPMLGGAGGHIGYSGIPGWAVEFDTHYVYGNPWDPPYQHIALTEIHAENHVYFFGGRVDLRNRWMYARVAFTALERNSTHIYGRLQVTVWDRADRQNLAPLGNVLINSSYTGWFKIYGHYLGFSAATGGQRDSHALWWTRVEVCPAPVGGVV